MGYEGTKCLKLIGLLRQNGKMKLAEIADKSNVNEKTARRWKSRLIEMGYNIKSTGGKNGGYELIEEKLTIDEWLRIKEWDINIYNKLTEILINRV